MFFECSFFNSARFLFHGCCIFSYFSEDPEGICVCFPLAFSASSRWLYSVSSFWSLNFILEVFFSFLLLFSYLLTHNSEELKNCKLLLLAIYGLHHFALTGLFQWTPDNSFLGLLFFLLDLSASPEKLPSPTWGVSGSHHPGCQISEGWTQAFSTHVHFHSISF